MGNRTAAAEGGSYRESFLLPISRLGVIYDSQPHGFEVFFLKPSGLELIIVAKGEFEYFASN
jgi:hypothetical protein